MRLMADNSDPRDLIDERPGPGSLILLKYGPGTGGDVLLKQLITRKREGRHCVYVSTHEGEKELMEHFKEAETGADLEILSFVDYVDKGLESTVKKDRFREEGILVTDLLELSSNSDRERKEYEWDRKILSGLSSVFRKQVLPFDLVVDSLSDLVLWTSLDEVIKRIWLLRSIVKEKEGVAIVAAPLGWKELDDVETTMFDAVFYLFADDSTGTWKRTLLLKNVKGDPSPPVQFDINMVKDIPEANSLE